jgi:hypothetical protein
VDPGNALLPKAVCIEKPTGSQGNWSGPACKTAAGHAVAVQAGSHQAGTDQTCTDQTCTDQTIGAQEETAQEVRAMTRYEAACTACGLTIYQSDAPINTTDMVCYVCGSHKVDCREEQPKGWRGSYANHHE